MTSRRRAALAILAALIACALGADALVACSNFGGSGSSGAASPDGASDADAGKPDVNSGPPQNAGANMVLCGGATCSLTAGEVCCNYVSVVDVQFKCVQQSAGCESESPTGIETDGAYIAYVSHIVECDDPSDCLGVSDGAPVVCCLGTLDGVCSNARIGDALCVPPGTCACKPGPATTIGFEACRSPEDCDGAACTDPLEPAYPWSYCAAP